MSLSDTSSAGERFSCYYESWLKKLEGHLQQLVLGRQLEYESIIVSLTAHHKDYYRVKWAEAHEDVLVFFSPQWASPLEAAFLWMTGWKPSMAFQLVDSLRRTRAPLTTLAQLTEAQVLRIDDLRARIRSEEEKVERDMERQQMALGDQRMVELARLASRRNEARDQVMRQVDGAVKGLLQGLEKVMKIADYTRLKTLKGLLDVLNPRQGVDFLAVFAMLQIQMRKLGKERAAASGTNIMSMSSTFSN